LHSENAPFSLEFYFLREKSDLRKDQRCFFVHYEIPVNFPLPPDVIRPDFRRPVTLLLFRYPDISIESQ